MAGIGFELKKLFGEDNEITKSVRAYIFSTIVSVGPWITTIITLNLFIVIANTLFNHISQKDLFMGTIVYCFVFSQILTAPWQLMVVRYISDKLYLQEYDYINASFIGLSKIILFISSMASLWYLHDKLLPIYYKFVAVILLMMISQLWIVMVYLSAIKNYKLISYAYVAGSALSIVAGYFLLKHPIPFILYQDATNLLIAYLLGVIVTYGILVYGFLNAFSVNNYMEYDFLHYFKKVPSLFFIGLFYTLGLWTDDILIWFSDIGIDVYNTYRFAPLYDNAVFFAYMTIMPTMVLFVVSVETKFYDVYKKLYALISNNGTYDHIKRAKKEMIKVFYKQFVYLLEVQTVITVTLIVLSKSIFAYMNIPLLLADIFKITALGALCNAFILVIILILLYYEARKHALMVTVIFFIGNVSWTIFFIPKGSSYFGFGYFIGTVTALIIGMIVLAFYLKDLVFTTFFIQPMFLREDEHFYDWIFNIIDWINTKKVPKEKKEKNLWLNHVYAGALVIVLFMSLNSFRSDEYNESVEEKLVALNEMFLLNTKESNLEGRESKSAADGSSDIEGARLQVSLTRGYAGGRERATIYIGDQPVMTYFGEKKMANTSLNPFKRASVISDRLRKVIKTDPVPRIVLKIREKQVVGTAEGSIIYSVTKYDSAMHNKSEIELGKEWAGNINRAIVGIQENMVDEKQKVNLKKKPGKVIAKAYLHKTYGNTMGIVYLNKEPVFVLAQDSRSRIGIYNRTKKVADILNRHIKKSFTEAPKIVFDKGQYSINFGQTVIVDVTISDARVHKVSEKELAILWLDKLNYLLNKNGKLDKQESQSKYFSFSKKWSRSITKVISEKDNDQHTVSLVVGSEPVLSLDANRYIPDRIKHQTKRAKQIAKIFNLLIKENKLSWAYVRKEKNIYKIFSNNHLLITVSPYDALDYHQSSKGLASQWSKNINKIIADNGIDRTSKVRVRTNKGVSSKKYVTLSLDNQLIAIFNSSSYQDWQMANPKKRINNINRKIKALLKNHTVEPIQMLNVNNSYVGFSGDKLLFKTSRLDAEIEGISIKDLGKQWEERFNQGLTRAVGLRNDFATKKTVFDLYQSAKNALKLETIYIDKQNNQLSVPYFRKVPIVPLIITTYKSNLSSLKIPLYNIKPGFSRASSKQIKAIGAIDLKTKKSKSKVQIKKSKSAQTKVERRSYYFYDKDNSGKKIVVVTFRSNVVFRLYAKNGNIEYPYKRASIISDRLNSIDLSKRKKFTLEKVKETYTIFYDNQNILSITKHDSHSFGMSYKSLGEAWLKNLNLILD